MNAIPAPTAQPHDGSDRLERVGLQLAELARALTVMKAMNGDKPLSVRAAAEAFNTTPHFIQGIVGFDSALYLAGPHENPGTQFIEIAAIADDGEAAEA